MFAVLVVAAVVVSAHGQFLRSPTCDQLLEVYKEMPSTLGKIGTEVCSARGCRLMTRLVLEKARSQISSIRDSVGCNRYAALSKNDQCELIVKAPLKAIKILHEVYGKSSERTVAREFAESVRNHITTKLSPIFDTLDCFQSLLLE